MKHLTESRVRNQLIKMSNCHRIDYGLKMSTFQLFFCIFLLIGKEFCSGSEDLFVPIARIEGTQLYSGLFYEMGMKSFPHGWVTWTPLETSDSSSKYVQIDIEPGDLENMRRGGSMYDGILWAFVPIDDHIDNYNETGFYTLRCKSFPNGIADVTPKLSDGYNYVTVRKNPGSEEKVLWKPVATSAEGLYLLKTDKYPNGSTTWTSVKYGQYSHYIQMDKKVENIPKYTEGGSWYGDSLFRLTLPQGLTLTWIVEDFQLSKPPEVSHRFQAEIRRRIIEHKVERNEGGTGFKTFSDNRVIDNLFKFHWDSYNYNESLLKSVNRIGGSLSLYDLTSVPLDGIFHTDSSFLELKKSNTLVFKNQMKFNKEIEMKVFEKTSTLVTISYDIMELDIPVRGILRVSCLVDRFRGDLSGVQKGGLPRGVLVELVKDKTIALDSAQFDEDSEVVLPISGRLKGSIVTDVVLTAEMDDTLQRNQF